jgi:hypothetical protein
MSRNITSSIPSSRSFSSATRSCSCEGSLRAPDEDDWWRWSSLRVYNKVRESRRSKRS